MDSAVRVLLSKVGLDGHDRGVKVVARLLRDAGMEVIYLGMYQTPEHVVSAAIHEDVDVIGVSTLSGQHLTQVPKLMDLVHARKLDDVVVVVGGVIPVEDIQMLKDCGVDDVFPAGTLGSVFVEGIHRALQTKRPAKLSSTSST